MTNPILPTCGHADNFESRRYADRDGYYIECTKCHDEYWNKVMVKALFGDSVQVPDTSLSEKGEK